MKKCVKLVISKTIYLLCNDHGVASRGSWQLTCHILQTPDDLIGRHLCRRMFSLLVMWEQRICVILMFVVYWTVRRRRQYSRVQYCSRLV